MPARRRTLDRDQVVRAAVDLVDEHGLAALTMRALGEQLGVQAMSLYNHVTNKDDLLDAMVDLVYGEVDLPGGPDWRAAIRRRCRSMRDVLVGHPWAIGLMDTRTAPGPNNLRHHDEVLGALRNGGFSVRGAVYAYGVVDAFVYGFALQQSALPFDDADELAAVSDVVVDQLPPEDYPHLRESAIELPATGFVFGDQFDDALDLVLDGLERVRTSDARTASPR